MSDQDDKASRYPCELRPVDRDAERSVLQSIALLRAWARRASSAGGLFFAGPVMFAGRSSRIFVSLCKKYKRIIRVTARGLVFQTKFPSSTAPGFEISGRPLSLYLPGSMWSRVGMRGVGAAPGAGIT